MKFHMLIIFILLTVAKCFLVNLARHENFSANKYENANYLYLYLYSCLLAEKMSCSAELSMKKVFTSGLDLRALLSTYRIIRYSRIHQVEQMHKSGPQVIKLFSCSGMFRNC